MCLSAQCHYAFCHSAECNYEEWHYSGCRYVEGHGAMPGANFADIYIPVKN